MDTGTKPGSSHLIVENLCVCAYVSVCTRAPVTKVNDSHYEDR